MGKYGKLADYASRQSVGQFKLTLIEIERIIGEKLPRSACRPQFWANTEGRGSPVREAMRRTHYQTFLETGSPTRVRFERWSR